MPPTEPISAAAQTVAGEPTRPTPSAWARTLRATMRARTDGAWQAVERSDAPAAGAPALRGRTLAPRLAAGGAGARPTDDGGRYALGGALGRGATASVWAVFDNALRRELAAKVLDGDAADADAFAAFIAEARTTASLQHPNVAPVHELDVAADGRPYFTMLRVEGRSLGDVLADAAAGAGPRPRVNTVVSIVIAIANALAYAHHRGIVHQDVKPDNVMLGAFGEVLLVDWGSAQRLADRPHQICGTPLYMAPEQARRESVDARSDVYALGATLFHALLLRPPTWSDEEDAFWRRKRLGEVDAPTAAERAAVPAPLIAIAVQAIAADPQRRYQAVEAMVDDLRSFQAGLAVSAERVGRVRRAARWCRRNARMLAVVVPAAASIVVLAALLAGQRLKQIATWGQPVFAEPARDLAAWAVAAGGFAIRDGAIVTTGDGENTLVLRERFEGDLALEYDAWQEPGARAGDLSAMWSDQVAFRPDGGADVTISDAMQAQFGARGGMFSQLNVGQHRSYSPARPRPGRRHHVRVELRDNVMTLTVDGVELCRLVDALPLIGGHPMLYGFYPGKCFADIRLYRRRVPELIAATAIGDSYLRDGDQQRAVVEYQRVIDAHPATAVAEEARFRLGLAHWRADRREDAEAAWRALADGGWRREVELLRIDGAIRRGDLADALARIEALAPREPSLARRLADLWSDAVETLVDARRHADIWELARQPPPQGPSRADRTPLVESYLAVRDRLLADQAGTGMALAEALLYLERWQDVLDRCPEQDWQRFAALEALGHPERILDERPRNEQWCARALVDMGRFDEMAGVLGADSPDLPERQPTALRLMGRSAEIAAHGWWHSMEHVDVGDFADVDRWGGIALVRALAMLGRGDELTGDIARLPEAQMALGRLDAALATGDEQPENWAWPRFLVGVRRAASGDPIGAAAWFAVPEAREFTQRHIEPARTLIAPLIAQLAGDAAAFDRGCAAIEARRRWVDDQRPWYIARRLRGAIDDAAFRAQPYRMFLEADLDLTHAVDADRRGDRAAAARAYRTWTARPAWQRAEVVDPVLDEFVAWRLAASGAPDAATTAHGADR